MAERKLSEAQKAALQRNRFKPGQSGNPKGRPPLPDEIKEALQARTLEAVAVAYDLMMNSTNEMVRLKATDMFLAPFVSKAAQKLDVDVQVTHMADILADAARARKTLQANVIEAVAVEPIKLCESPSNDFDT
ncbi:DUF5681 domain-containing protein [Agrobacterium sp. rho-8.1]|nr:DUF5681 domain-containing protein [Agrobacterium sp. rho-8.1]